MHFNKCLQMVTFPQHILIITAPNWSSLVHYDESGTMEGGGGAARSGQQLELLADSSHPGLGHHPAQSLMPHTRQGCCQEDPSLCQRANSPLRVRV